MAVTQTELESRAIELSTEAFDAFCDDISGMFEVDIKCVAKEASEETVSSLKKRFKKITAISNVDTNGAIHGRFYLVFDQGGLFTLSGVIVMLPEKRILQEIKRGTIQDVDSMNDAVGETGNLCVGSWDRIFREEYEGHGHFVQVSTFIGNPWENPEESIGLNSEETLLFYPFEMTVGNYPTFTCGVIFPKSIFAPETEEVTENKEVAQENVETEQIDAASDEIKEKDSLENSEAVEDTIVQDASEQTGKEISSEQETSEQANQVVEDTETKVKKDEHVSESTLEQQVEKPVSETIKRIAESPAILPGQPLPKVQEEPVHNKNNQNKSDIISLSVCAKDIMDTNVTWCSPDESVQQAIEKMQHFDTGYLLIGNEGLLEGIVSRSDITGAISPYIRSIFSKWRRPLDDATLNIRIKWIMRRPVHTVKPETTITKVMENMRQSGVRCFPVANQDGKVEGIITVFDIFKALDTNNDVSSMGKTIQVPLLI